jgi:hypothetical protein
MERFRESNIKRLWRNSVIVLLGLIDCKEWKTLTGLL